jgi:hypothetical protein
VSLCILAGGKTLTLAVSAFTLAWSHSVEKTRWEEDWRIAPHSLEIIEARVKGSGAGMEPPEGAVLKNGWWAYAPSLPPIPDLLLAASGTTQGGWSLCAKGQCTVMGAAAGEPVRLRPCGGADQ